MKKKGRSGPTTGGGVSSPKNASSVSNASPKHITSTTDPLPLSSQPMVKVTKLPLNTASKLKARKTRSNSTELKGLDVLACKLML